jgi:hypothetical protein
MGLRTRILFLFYIPEHCRRDPCHQEGEACIVAEIIIGGGTMTDKAFDFIGGGRITRTLLEGLARAGNMQGNIVVTDKSAEALWRM